MQAFVWNARYETGIRMVDEQHRQLVALINELAEAHGREAGVDTVDGVLDRLSDYARYHFSAERGLMEDSGIDREGVAGHMMSHGSFITQLGLMRAWVREAPQKVAPELLRYLTAWLAEHILGEDQAMARQIRAVAEGTPPHLAYSQHKGPIGGSRDMLVEAMHRLFDELASRNAELARRNAQLKERERELQAARQEFARVNERLEQRLAERAIELLEVSQRLSQALEHERELTHRLQELRRTTNM